jgi:uncharacterized damage-inducible protein DinB
VSVAYAPLDIAPLWGLVNEDLIELVGSMSEEQIEWSPRPKLWNSKGILIHLCFGRHGLMQMIVKDGLEGPDIIRAGQTKAGLAEQLRLSWERMQPFLRDPEALAREYEAMTLGETGILSGHELAFGQLEHDIHHRADILHYLRELGVAHEEPDTLLRVIRARGK